MNQYYIYMDEEKFKVLSKKFNVPENFPNMIVPKPNAEIWKNNLNFTYKIYEIRLQTIQKLSFKFAYAVTEACDNILDQMAKMKQDQSK